MNDFLKLMLHLAFVYVAVYVGGWLLLAMLPFILEVWEVFATLIAIGVGFYLYKFIQFYREENKKTSTKNN